MLNILIHHYFGIGTEEVWAVIERDIPELKLNIQAILRELEENSNDVQSDGTTETVRK
jgi:uncharacterized protein with HEPN domain